MESVVAKTATMVPFHCVICFEQFTLHKRPPVVLPCGHTYVCAVCAKRLDKCMECRQSLLWTPPTAAAAQFGRTQQGTPSARIASSSRYNYGRPVHRLQQAPPFPAKVEPVPLPLPKNLVLLSMIEAADRRYELEETYHSFDDDETLDDPPEEEDELKRITCGLASISGPFGTYAVRAPEGLAVIPYDPRKRNSESAENIREPYSISLGQTVQVVDVQDGVAKLARGAGYIVASASQLVKVGGPLDASCELEGMLEMARRRRNQLQTALDEVDGIETMLKQKLDRTRQSEPSYPIIKDAPDVSGKAHFFADKEDGPSTPLRDNAFQFGRESPNAVVTGATDDGGIEVFDSRGVPMYSLCQRETASPNTIDNADIDHSWPRDRYDGCRDHMHLSTFVCGTSLFGERFLDAYNQGENLMGISFDSYDEASTAGGSLRTTGENTPPRNCNSTCASTVVTSSSASVNFRTGLSGHGALTRTKATSPRSAPSSRGAVRMMSDHKGIGRVRGPLRKRTQGTTPFLNPI